MSIFKAIGVVASVGTVAAVSFYAGYRFREYKYEEAAKTGPAKAKRTVADEAREEWEALKKKVLNSGEEISKEYKERMDKLKEAIDDMEKSNTAEKVREDIRAFADLLNPKK